MNNTLIYSTDDEALSSEQFEAWSNRFLKKKDIAVKLARVILNNK